jgi:hypothetical protein
MLNAIFLEYVRQGRRGREEGEQREEWRGKEWGSGRGGWGRSGSGWKGEGVRE